MPSFILHVFHVNGAKFISHVSKTQIGNFFILKEYTELFSPGTSIGGGWPGSGDEGQVDGPTASTGSRGLVKESGYSQFYKTVFMWIILYRGGAGWFILAVHTLSLIYSRPISQNRVKHKLKVHKLIFRFVVCKLTLRSVNDTCC